MATTRKRARMQVPPRLVGDSAMWRSGNPGVYAQLLANLCRSELEITCVDPEILVALSVGVRVRHWTTELVAWLRDYCRDHIRSHLVDQRVTVSDLLLAIYNLATRYLEATATARANDEKAAS
jgi:hypothetical protein